VKNVVYLLCLLYDEIMSNASFIRLRELLGRDTSLNDVAFIYIVEEEEEEDNFFTEIKKFYREYFAELNVRRSINEKVEKHSRFFIKKQDMNKIKVVRTVNNIFRYLVNFINEHKLFIAWFCSGFHLEKVVKSKIKSYVYDGSNKIINCNYRTMCGCVAVCFSGNVFERQKQREKVIFYPLSVSNALFLGL